MAQRLSNLPKVIELTNGQGLQPMLSLDFFFNKCAQNLFHLTHTRTPVHLHGIPIFGHPLLNIDGHIALSPILKLIYLFIYFYFWC